MNKYEKGQQIPISGIITITGVQQNKAGNFLYSTDRSAVIPEFLIERLEMKPYENPFYAAESQPTQPIAPQEDKPKFKVGQRVIATDNIGYFVKQIATILDIDKSDPYTPFKAMFDEGKLIMWCHSEDVEPYSEPGQPKEPIVLYCVKDYKALLSPMFTRGKIYETDENEQIKADSGLTTYRKWNSDKMKKEFPEMFASLIPLVKRPAKVGEWVLLTNVLCASNYGNGEIYKVSEISVGKPVISGKTWETVLLQSEYLVLDNYTPEPEKEPEPVYFSGKVVCTATDGDGTFTVGKVYEFINGQVLDNGSYKRPTGIKMKSLNDAYLANWYYRFIPYLGEA